MGPSDSQETDESTQSHPQISDEAGLKIYSLYVGVTLGPGGASYDPIVAEAIGQLKGRDTVVEFFVDRFESDGGKHDGLLTA